MQKSKIVILFILFSTLAFKGFSQTGDSIMVREDYFRTPLSKVFHDFETKYGMELKYDSLLVSKYTLEYQYFGTPLQRAFDVIFRLTPDLAYFTDEDGAYTIVLKKNMPRNRTGLENRRFEGSAIRQNLTVTGRIKDQTNGEPLPFATVFVDGNTTIATATNTDGYFTLYNVPSDTEILIFRYLGYETQRFYLSPKVNVENLFVELVPAINTLDEVVIVREREDVLKIPELSIGVIQTTSAKIADLPARQEQRHHKYRREHRRDVRHEYRRKQRFMGLFL